MIHDLSLPPIPVALPEGYRLVSNEVRLANREHKLDCGCHVEAGTYYHRAALIYQHGRKPVVLKNHLFGCDKAKVKERPN